MHYLLFDLDGTLTDPGLGITNSVAYALARFNIHPATREELYPYIGPPLTVSFRQRHGLSPEQAEQALGYYREYFGEMGIFENEIYPGIPAFLEALREEGYTLMVATSKPEEYTHRILEYFELAQYFTFVGGNTLDERRPTKEAVVAYVLEQYPDIRGENALMIGDREYDMRGGRHNGLSPIGVLYGYGNRRELEDAGAEGIAADLPSLMAEIHRLLPPK